MGGLFKRGMGLFDLEKTMVSVLHKELEYKMDNLKYKKVGGHAAKTNPNFGKQTIPDQSTRGQTVVID